MSEESIIKDVIAAAPNRRSFVAKLGLAGAAIGAIASTKANAQSPPTITDADILNFALNLEYLEADFYSVATTGMTIDQFGVNISGSGKVAATTGGNVVPWSDPEGQVKRIAKELALNERTHVVLLQSAIQGLGGTPIGKPAINLAALGIGFGSEIEFLTLARIFEDIGVTAYGGAAPLIKSSAILGYAARILATEAEHAGAIRVLVDRFQIPTTALDGADINPPPSGPQIFPLNSSAITEVRTPGQVLYLAYGSANATAGGFFPSGVNGSLNTSAATPATYDGATLTASPNPIARSSSGFGQTTLTWNAPGSQLIQIRLNSPSGPLFTYNYGSGSMATGPWVTDGMTFYLQDVTGGKSLTIANTLATLTVHLQH